MSHIVWNSYTKDAFDRNWNNFIIKYGLEGNKWLSGSVHHTLLVRAVRGSAYMDHNLLRSPLLGWDEKHIKEREHALIFQQVHYTQQLLETIHEQYDNCLASRKQTERKFDVIDFHTMIPCATKSAIEA
ncbi:hypothetical protein Ahy_A04g019235 [Arachis hypogaea]|uniref:Protein FAR1-RELATED SEQUENCE n=1 Tax=Arachis hypogaea TaxID=3818 RepID=A0A445DFI9_ARAHY|nr:hypothetical protein Ahy_A04g019235 [Arachis hypogaea]